MIHSWLGPIRVPDDLEWEPLRPWRKKRGKRRYYRTLARDASLFSEQPTGWYDLMHWHVDWDGMGNLSWRSRRAHLAALFTTYERLLAQLDGWAEPHQCWVLIDPADSANDAVYLHTKNPNRNNFPLDLAWVEWNAAVPERLREFVHGPSLQFGRAGGDNTTFIVRRHPVAEPSVPRGQLTSPPPLPHCGAVWDLRLAATQPIWRTTTTPRQPIG